MKGPGGTEGGVGKFAIGFALAALAVYLLLDSVHVQAGYGWVSGLFRGGQGQPGAWQTTSTAIVFVPFVVGILALFYDASQRWAWYLTLGGLAVVAVEILSRIRFVFDIKTTHLLGILALFAAGAGLMLRSYRDEAK
jgi:hypothetical protein